MYSGDGVPLTEDIVMHSKEYFNSYDIEEERSVDKGTTITRTEVTEAF